MSKIYSKLLYLWHNVPENIREAIKEGCRWIVATIYAIIWDMVQEGEVDLKDPMLLLKVIIFRLVDRIGYTLTDKTDWATIKAFIRRLLIF